MATRRMIFAGLFAGLVAVLGYFPPIPLPFTPVPITLQTLGVMLAGGILGGRLGGVSMLVLVLLAAVGAPVLSGGGGGLARLLGPTGGYIFGWIFGAYFIGILVEKSFRSLSLFKVFIFNIVGGIIIIYAFGIPYLAYVTEMSLPVAFTTNLIYLPGDLLKAFVAALIIVRINKSYPIIRRG